VFSGHTSTGLRRRMMKLSALCARNPMNFLASQISKSSAFLIPMLTRTELMEASIKHFSSLSLERMTGSRRRTSDSLETEEKWASEDQSANDFHCDSQEQRECLSVFRQTLLPLVVCCDAQPLAMGSFEDTKRLRERT
jgi:hypothetical protein